MKKILVTIFLFAFVFAGYAQNADAVVGVWWNDIKSSKIEITKKGDKFFGTIRYIIPEKYVDGQPEKDYKNPDKSLRDRSLLGLNLLKNFEYDADNEEWENGTIYDPKSGKTYSCYMWLESNDVLRLKGYVMGMRWLGRKTTWTRTTL